MGVVAFAKSLADEVGRDGTLANNVCSGSILTERMLSNVTARAKDLGMPVEKALEQRAAETAVGRTATRRRWRIWSPSLPPAGPATSPAPPCSWTAASSARFSRPAA